MFNFCSTRGEAENCTAKRKAEQSPVVSVSYPLRPSRARNSRSDIRVKTPLMTGVYTEYTSLLQDMGAAIALTARLWINFIDTTPGWQTCFTCTVDKTWQLGVEWATYYQLKYNEIIRKKNKKKENDHGCLHLFVLMWFFIPLNDLWWSTCKLPCNPNFVMSKSWNLTLN